MIKLVIFDNFGVICHEAAPFWFPEYFSDEESKRLKSGIVYQADLGKIGREELYAALSEAIGGAETPQQIENSWVALAKKDDSMVALIKKIRKIRKTALLSNAVEGLLERLYTPEETEELFDYRAVSYIEHCAKPDPRLYLLLLERAGVKPEEAVFTDDNPANIAAAEKLGIHGIVFENPAQFEKALAPYLGNAA